MSWRDSRRAVAAAVAAGVLALAGVVAVVMPRGGVEPAVAVPVQAHPVGSAACGGCHAAALAAWQASDHAHAMLPADAASVRGDFARRPPKGSGVIGLVRRPDAYGMVLAGADGTPVEVAISHTFGWRPLQQYLVSQPDGRKQMLGLAWDARPREAGGQRWFHLFPRDGVAPGQVNHWAGNEQNWNYQCADCHATALTKGYDPTTNRFDTRWAELGVGCEACHGPGSAHVAWAAADAEARGRDATQGLTVRLDERRGVVWQNSSRGAAAVGAAATGAGPPPAGAHPVRSAPRTTAREITACARCHARRGQLGDHTQAGDAFLDGFRPALIESPLYWPDGQQRDEVFTWASFLQSRMHAAGVTCSDCHEPHGGGLRATGNAVCAQCHATARYDAPEHHHHTAGSPGAQCVDCHMPPTTYMEVDPRHDHSLRVPRPDRTLRLGVPNACGHCHAARGAAWAADAARRWWPDAGGGFQSFAEAFAAAEAGAPGADAALIGLIGDATQPAVVRASALAHLAQPLAPPALSATTAALADADDLVRLGALRAMEGADANARRYHLAARLTDPRLAIRTEAARLLALAGGADAAQRTAYERALAEYEATLAFSADRPEALAARAALRLAQGDATAAEADLRMAVARDPTHAVGWVNLADLLVRQRRGSEALAALRRGAESTGGAAAVRHALGLALIRQGQRGPALAELAAASRAAPDNARFAYVHAVALHDGGQAALAMQLAASALARQPWHRDLLMAMAYWQIEARQPAAAAATVAKLRQLAPDDPQIRDLALSVGQLSGS